MIWEEGMNESELREFARQIRRLSLFLVYKARASHIGGGLSQADILAVLYSGCLNISPETVDSPHRDRFILSKGHCCASYYAALAIKGFMPRNELMQQYSENGSLYFEHVSHKLPGVEFSSGSLGHGLSVACGMALRGKTSSPQFDVYVLCGDGEMDEGSNWEAIMFACHHRLDNLCIIIDCNGWQALGPTEEVLSLHPLSERLQAFGCHVLSVDGHDVTQLRSAFESFKNCSGAPTVIVANTIKGKGVSFMENNLRFHYSPPSADEYERAKIELS